MCGLMTSARTVAWEPAEVVLREARFGHGVEHGAHLLVADVRRATQTEHHLAVGRARRLVVTQLRAHVHERCVVVVGVQHSREG